MNFCLANKEDALAIARIHTDEIKEGFLSQLGTPFLSKFYEAIIKDPNSFCIILEENNKVTGFISGTTHIKKFYAYFLKNYWFVAIILLLPKIFNLSVIKKIIEDLFYTKKTADLPEAELLTIALKKELQSKGLGSKLVDELIREFKSRKVQTFKVLVGKKDALSRFYQKNNFQLLKEINLHSTAPSLIFIHTIR
ncbi:MAG: hypothetical protein A3A98_04240 [Candidatus Staskawiczbacteria bacterium RIFCSPLOWO2_01_FULL_40_39]|uniref:N-acetyltransferase domain-containing protein n=1 Tax=Candidatus Staskawiczbacteria bacterium RIFCSPHIGHO2_01_FULL_39_25 TaxID=1802202 RepID=A0A1G2HPL5_9BACT|nr:MAG: hypothetical protein A2730_03455 [Candidatus Staskawiczbacteria bacterium RIFCSPHIGHO2_01_FULL_39_25]OGZ73978.1 MAG: hypothetical protein A3A98_04240 [Candidatus Staskawiczbacteria bacterium RIFCSPLOWO2_01_FULL_40_39]OGZ76435.1 MAG: hypothetical protein A3I87_02385 [Candidatus Staskawiczbacteria bacterium RIFCSPLOWO2_02_FULL_39_8]